MQAAASVPKEMGKHFAHTKEQKNAVSHVVHSTLAFYFNSLFFKNFSF